jgi:small subunit ribosomal protein S7
LHVKPIVILQSRKRGGTVYQLPYIVQNLKKDNSTLIAIRWFVKAAVNNTEIGLSFKLANVFVDAFNNKGSCIKKKLDIYDLALKNRVYSRFLFPNKKIKLKF